MRAGQLRHRVTVQQPDTTAASGFSDVDTVSADLMFQPAASDAMDAGGPSAVGAHRVRIRYRSDVRADWRLTEGDRTYQVVGYGDPDGRRRELLLVCTEVQ